MSTCNSGGTGRDEHRLGPGGGVTAVLRDLLNDGLINHNVASVIGTTVTVSVMPPDRVVPTNGPTEASQLNLFLHKVTPNMGWRNDRLPARDSSGSVRLSDPPLALDLHYLLTAFTSADLHAEILLGYGMQLLHENPVLTRQAIRTALSPAPDVGVGLPAALRALDATGLADQIEQLRITPVPLDTEESQQTVDRDPDALPPHHRVHGFGGRPDRVAPVGALSAACRR